MESKKKFRPNYFRCKGNLVDLLMTNYFKHETAIVDFNVLIGDGTKIWHFSHISENAQIGKNVIIGQNVFIGKGVIIGNGCKIQNNVSVYEGVTLEDDVFVGPAVVFTNINLPRAYIEQKDKFLKTLVKKGASIGANSTIICGNTLGENCFIGAGSLVTKNTDANSLYYGHPAKFKRFLNKQ
jgi:UDP-2-acetamido-3-amino-2,3-dideoxy-glucuronate N-acetyltransferase